MLTFAVFIKIGLGVAPAQNESGWDKTKNLEPMVIISVICGIIFSMPKIWCTPA